MQISRHWRLNSQRYMLGGSIETNGATSLQPPQPEAVSQDQKIQAVIANMRATTEIDPRVEAEKNGIPVDFLLRHRIYDDELLELAGD